MSIPKLKVPEEARPIVSNVRYALVLSKFNVRGNMTINLLSGMPHMASPHRLAGLD